MRHGAVQDLNAPDAAVEGRQGAVRLRQHAFGNHTGADQCLGFSCRHGGDRDALSIEDARRVGQQDELFGGDLFGDATGDQIGVDVVRGAAGPTPIGAITGMKFSSMSVSRMSVLTSATSRRDRCR